MLLNPTSSMMHRRFALIGLSDAEVHEITPALSRVGAQTEEFSLPPSFRASIRWHPMTCAS